jgi:polyferredoxin
MLKLIVRHRDRLIHFLSLAVAWFEVSLSATSVFSVLCGAVIPIKSHHRVTENTEVAQRKIKQSTVTLAERFGGA